MKDEIQNKINTYPKDIRPFILELRTLILEVAKEQNQELEESLKWNELSYSVKLGSNIRLDWKEKYPKNYFLYFNCNTKLVETFRKIYFDTLSFEKNRAIILEINKAFPKEIVKHCIELAFTYKNIKHLPMLGV
jgi:hypothetical protein